MANTLTVIKYENEIKKNRKEQSETEKTHLDQLSLWGEASRPVHTETIMKGSS